MTSVLEMRAKKARRGGRISRIEAAKKLAESDIVLDADWHIGLAVDNDKLAFAAAGCRIPQDHKIAARALMNYVKFCRKIGDRSGAYRTMAALWLVIQDKKEKRAINGT